MKILLVDDSPSVQMSLSVLLTQFGYQVITADDGQQAWHILQEQSDLHCVLTDWKMPHIDGLQLCQIIRQAQWSYYIYIILLTAKDDKADIVKGMEAGADDYLTKPVDHNELRARLKAGQRILELEQTLGERNQKLQWAYEQISQDLQSAAQVQRALLPKPGFLGLVQFDWLFYPSRFIAGDIFNFFPLTEEYIAFYQLDVSGHGVPSALLSFTLFHALAPHQTELFLSKNDQPRPPEDVLFQLNNRFQTHSHSNLYFTIIYGFIHQPTGEVQLAQAGHPSPIYFVSLNEPGQTCGKGGVPLGLFTDMSYENIRFKLQPGDRLFLYSDGVIECADKNNSFFSENRLLNLLEQLQQNPLENVLPQVGEALKQWRNQEVFEDDISLLAIEYISLK